MRFFYISKQLVLALLFYSISGCSVTPNSPAESSHVNNTLIAQAEVKIANGETPQAIAILERAVRLQPRNAHAWLKLAELYLAQGKYRKAEQFAGRAKQFSAGNRQLLHRSKQIIRQAINHQPEQG